MKQVITVCVLSLGLLVGCNAPDYATDDEAASSQPTETVEESVEVVAYNGVVLEITDNNELLVKLDDPLSASSAGLSVNPEGVTKVALAAIAASDKEKLHQQLSNFTLGKNVSLDLTDIANTEAAQAYVNILSSDTKELLQQRLLEDGIVTLKDKEQYSEYLQVAFNKSEKVINELINTFIDDKLEITELYN